VEQLAAYKQITDKIKVAGPFVRVPGLELDGYVTTKALDDLFVRVGEEQRRIRETPAARSTWWRCASVRAVGIKSLFLSRRIKTAKFGAWQVMGVCMNSTPSWAAVVRLSVVVVSALLVGCLPLRNRQDLAKDRAWDAAVEQFDKHNARRFLIQWKGDASWDSVQKDWIVRIYFLSHGGRYIAHVDPDNFCVVAEAFLNKFGRSVTSLEDALGASEADF